MADYLATLDWVNVDGDWISQETDPKVLAKFEGLEEAIGKNVNEQPMTAKEWKVTQLYLKGLVDKAKAEAKKGINAAVSFVLYTKKSRDYIRSLVPTIQFVRIDVELSKMMASNRVRQTKMCEGYGMTLAEMYDQYVTPEEKEKLGGEYTDERLDKYFQMKYYSGLKDFEESEKAYTHVIDNNSYGKPGLEHLRKIVGISGDFEYDRTAIENVQQARYANTAAFNEAAAAKE